MVSTGASELGGSLRTFEACTRCAACGVIDVSFVLSVSFFISTSVARGTLLVAAFFKLSAVNNRVFGVTDTGLLLEQEAKEQMSPSIQS